MINSRAFTLVVSWNVSCKAIHVHTSKKNMKGLSAILERARTNPGESASGGSSTGRGGAFKSDTVELSLLDAADQVEALVTLATHPATLSRIWVGWAPFK
mmetsp:Transcript_67358/g.109206  ORF Transcript_67358/g.109206 Transcript_67358/m.109206 type:complete len:100 (+) Transcript_67358:179-478(+)